MVEMIAFDVRLCVCLSSSIRRFISGTTNKERQVRCTGIQHWTYGPHISLLTRKYYCGPIPTPPRENNTCRRAAHLDHHVRHGEVLSPHALVEDCKVQRGAVLPLFLHHDILGLHQKSVGTQHSQRQQRVVGCGDSVKHSYQFQEMINAKQQQRHWRVGQASAAPAKRTKTCMMVMHRICTR